MGTPLRDVTYAGGLVRFDVGTGPGSLRFSGNVREDSIEGPIHSSTEASRPVGFFSLRYLE
jgi:hypothetical protein